MNQFFGVMVSFVVGFIITYIFLSIMEFNTKVHVLVIVDKKELRLDYRIGQRYQYQYTVEGDCNSYLYYSNDNYLIGDTLAYGISSQ